MRTRLLSLLLALVAFAASFALPRAAFAQDLAPESAQDEIQRRVEWLRSLPATERARLREALQSFRSLPAEEREALRQKAARLGPERLEALKGRDLAKLAKCRKLLVSDVDHVMTSVGNERVAALTADERTYLRSEAMRGFERHLRTRLLGQALLASDWEKLVPDERHRRVSAAVQTAIEERLNAVPDEERARILALPREEQLRERARLFHEFRRDEAQSFAQLFGNFRVTKFLEKSPPERAEIVRRWSERARWHAVVRLLREEIGIADDARRDLAALGPADWAKLSAEVRDTESLPLDERRARLESSIHKLAGERALDTSTRGPDLPPFLQQMRERRLRDGRFAPK